MIDLMLDIETLGRGPGCIVTQVAIVPFHLTGTPLSDVDLEEFTYECKLSVGKQLARGYTIDSDTLDWWMKQKEDVRKSVFGGDVSPLSFKIDFGEYLRDVVTRFTNYRIWASAPKLDFGCLHSLLAEPGKEYPILYSAERDLRTLRELVKMIDSGFKLPKGFNPHDAIEDCKRQIIDAQACYEYLKTRNLIKNETIGSSSDVHEDVRTNDTDGTNNSVKRDNGSEDQTVAGGAR